MSYATEAQRSLIRHLSGTSVEAAAQAYGFAPGHILSIDDASQMIDSLKNPAPVVAPRTAEDIAAADHARAEDEARRVAEAIARQAAQQADTAKFDAILIERGLGHLTGAERREARRLIRRELEK